MARCRVCKLQGVLPIALLFLLLLSVARAPAAPPILTSGPEGQIFSFPWPPAWVAQGKYQKMVLKGIIGFNPGQWDVQACGTLPDCLMPSGPQFNGLVYHNPVNPDEIVCDLCESWTVSPDGKTYTFRLREAQWHDGKPVTAEDIKFSLDRIVEPGHQSQDRGVTHVLRTPERRGGGRQDYPRADQVRQPSVPGEPGLRVHEDVPEAHRPGPVAGGGATAG